MATRVDDQDHFPDDFPRRLERLRESLGVSWNELARQTGLSARALHRWRAGVRPNAAHLLLLLDFASEHDVLDVLLDRDRANDQMQGVLFDAGTWADLTDESSEVNAQARQRAA